jgi:hypothetical protein
MYVEPFSVLHEVNVYSAFRADVSTRPPRFPIFLTKLGFLITAQYIFPNLIEPGALAGIRMLESLKAKCMEAIVFFVENVSISGG